MPGVRQPTSTTHWSPPGTEERNVQHQRVSARPAIQKQARCRASRIALPSVRRLEAGDFARSRAIFPTGPFHQQATKVAPELSDGARRYCRNQAIWINGHLVQPADLLQSVRFVWVPVAGIVSGRIVGRLHSSERVAMVFIFAGFGLFWGVAQLAVLVMIRWLPHEYDLTNHVLAVGTLVLTILLGGLGGSASRSRVTLANCVPEGRSIVACPVEWSPENNSAMPVVPAGPRSMSKRSVSPASRTLAISYCSYS